MPYIEPTAARVLVTQQRNQLTVEWEGVTLTSELDPDSGISIEGKAIRAVYGDEHSNLVRRGPDAFEIEHSAHTTQTLQGPVTYHDLYLTPRLIEGTERAEVSQASEAVERALSSTSLDRSQLLDIEDHPTGPRPYVQVDYVGTNAAWLEVHDPAPGTTDFTWRYGTPDPEGFYSPETDSGAGDLAALSAAVDHWAYDAAHDSTPAAQIITELRFKGELTGKVTFGDETAGLDSASIEHRDQRHAIQVNSQPGRPGTNKFERYQLTSLTLDRADEWRITQITKLPNAESAQAALLTWQQSTDSQALQQRLGLAPSLTQAPSTSGLAL